MVNLDQVRSVSVSADAEPLLFLEFEGGSISEFKAVDGHGTPLTTNNGATERDLLRHFRELLASTQALQRP